MNAGMRRSTLAAVLLLLAMTAAAEDRYLPLGGRGSRTELQIANSSPARTSVTLELLGNANAVEIALDAGQTMRWNDAASELFGASAELGALRISAAAAVDVTALSHCAACGARVTVPVLDARRAIDEGAVPMRARLPWRSGMLVVNPGDGVALLTLSVHRGDQLVDQSLVRIPARGTRRVLLDRAADQRVTFRAARPLLLFGYDSNERTGANVFTPIAPLSHGGKHRSVRTGPSPAPPVEPQTIVLTPSKDNTLFESPTGAGSNGAGVHLFTGATATRSLRRALLAFDVASQIPPGSRITRATLTMRVSLTIAGPQRMALHRVTADWGEGSSNAGSSRDGTGASARTGDATWLHRFFPDQRWTAQGGDFNATPDATVTAGDPIIWETSAAMIARVQEWLDQPASNFGWIVLGNETQSTTAKRLDSREIPNANTRPVLTIEFLR